MMTIMFWSGFMLGAGLLWLVGVAALRQQRGNHLNTVRRMVRLVQDAERGDQQISKITLDDEVLWEEAKVDAEWPSIVNR